MSPEVRAELTLDGSSAEDTINALGDQLDAIFGGSQSIDIPISADTSEAEAAIAGLADAPPVDIPVSADTGEAVAAIDSIAAEPIDVPVTIDTGDAQSQLDNLDTSVTDLSSNLDSSGGSTSSASTELQNYGSVAETTGSSVGGSALEVAGISVGFAAAAGAAVTAASAQERYNQTFGPFGDLVKQVNIPGISGDYIKLGESVGIAANTVQNVLVGNFLRATDVFHLSSFAAIDFTKASTNLALNVQALHPELGTLDAVQTRLNNAFLTGGVRLQRLGINVSENAVAQQVMANQVSGVNGAFTDQAGVLDTRLAKAYARQQIASFELTDEQKHLQDEAHRSNVEIDKLRVAFEGFIAKTVAPAVIPVLDFLSEHIPQIGEAFSKYFEIASLEIRKVIDIIGILAPHIADLANSAADLFSRMEGQIDTAAESIHGAINAVTTFVSQTAAQIRDFVSGAISDFANMGRAVGQAATSVHDFFSTAASATSDAVKNSIEALKGAFDHVNDAAHTAASAVGDFVGRIAGIVGKTITVTIEVVQHGAEAAAFFIAGVASAAYNAVISVVQNGAEAAGSFIAGVATAAYNAVINVAQHGAEAAGSAISAVASAAYNAVINVTVSGLDIAKNAISQGADLAKSAYDNTIGRLSGGSITPRAGGGSLGVGQLGLVGEEGPELFIPTTTGYVLPHQESVQVANDLSNALTGRVGGDQPQPAVVKVTEQPVIVVVRDMAEAAASFPVLGRADPSFVMGRR